MKLSNKGFIIILVIAVLAVLILVAFAVVNIGCGEALQTTTRNSNVPAYYMAVAGAERMYAVLRDLSNKSTASTNVSWPQTISSTNVQVNGTTVGSFSVEASELTGETDTFMIVSTGTVRGRTARVTVKYGFSSNYMNGVPLGSVGPIDLLGHRIRILIFNITSWVRAQGPVQSGGSITPSATDNSVRFVKYSGDVQQNQVIVPPTFWVYDPLDTTNTGIDIPHSDPDSITLAEAQAAEAGGLTGAENAFEANDVNNDSVVNNSDAFYYYYTTWLNDAANNQTGADLGINPGGAHYYEGDQTFGPTAVPAGTNIVFVNGDADVVYNAQKWWPSASDLTIVATGDITIVQPVNGADDRLSLVSDGNIVTGGINLSIIDLADVDGNLNMYCTGNFVALFGGVTNGSIFANGTVSADTGLPSFLFNRDINQGTDNWTNASSRPLGLPPNYRTITRGFVIKAENRGVSGYNPRWQKR